MEILAQYGFHLVLFAAFVGFVMAYGVGANDVANAMGTSVGSKALTIKQAIIIAAIFEFTGAFFAGGEVTSTIRSGIIDAKVFAEIPELLAYGMIAALIAAGTWLLVATYFGWPVSTTHSIVGAIIGFGAVGVGMDAVHWDEVGLTYYLSYFLRILLLPYLILLNPPDVKRLLLRHHYQLKSLVLI